jgi:hypothetical protein
MCVCVPMCASLFVCVCVFMCVVSVLVCMSVLVCCSVLLVCVSTFMFDVCGQSSIFLFPFSGVSLCRSLSLSLHSLTVATGPTSP